MLTVTTYTNTAMVVYVVSDNIHQHSVFDATCVCGRVGAGFSVVITCCGCADVRISRVWSMLGAYVSTCECPHVVCDLLMGFVIARIFIV